MRRVWVLALLSVVACSERQAQGSGAGQDKSAAALANKDEQCPGGTVKGCLDAAMEAEQRAEVARAVELYTRACDAGVARACNVLGILVWQGRGVIEDPTRAYSLYVRACDGGDPSGCFNASVCHKTGSCAEKNAAEATKFLQRACDGGDQDACANLGGR
jgi:hypothetical protein